jgi:sulfoxide reductase heme-binding subunit YedZ
MKKALHNRLLILTHLGALLPLGWLVFDWLTDNLSVNPIQDITLRTGKTALILLILSLATTPLNTVFGLREALPLRKWLGLYAFFYVSLHFLIFIGLDYGFDLTLLREAIFEKRFTLVGFAAGVVLLPLAFTSTRGWMKRLGKNWKRLHRLAYLAGALAIVHYIWLVKSDIREPLVYGAILALLLLVRIPVVRKKVSRLHLRSYALKIWFRSVIRRFLPIS